MSERDTSILPGGCSSFYDVAVNIIESASPSYGRDRTYGDNKRNHKDDEDKEDHYPTPPQGSAKLFFVLVQSFPVPLQRVYHLPPCVAGVGFPSWNALVPGTHAYTIVVCPNEAFGEDNMKT